MARVRIVKLPKAIAGGNMRPGLYGTNGNNQFTHNGHLESGKIAQQPIEARQTLEPVDREDANLEAEKGETAVINVDGMPAHFKIGGKRHSKGGTPLNLPDNSFIFSDTAKMKIKDPTILAQFGMKPQKGGYTPAEISKKYDINKFRKTLADPNSEDMDRKTAEMMIANYNLKLAKLALAQESIKGFPQGIPVIAMPYIESMEIDPSTFMPDQAQGQLEQGTQPDAEMGTSRFGGGLPNLPKAQAGWAKQIPRDGRAYNVADLKRQAKAETVPFSVELAKKKEAAKTLAQENEAAYYADLQDAQTDAQMNALYKQYAKVQERVAAGDVEADFGDYIPFVPNSAEKELEKFKSMARAQGKNPTFLEKQITTGVNYNEDPRMRKEAPPIDPVKKAVETKVKNWLKPTAEEVDKLSDDELMFLNRLHKKYKVMGYAYGGSTSLTQYQEKGEVQETAADIRKKYKEKITGKKEETAVKKGTTKGTTSGTTSKEVGIREVHADGTPLTPEEEAERIKRAGTTPEKYVSDEEYAELEALYKAAKASSGGNENKKTKETLAFQKRYHELLPDEAQRIIASEKDPTTKGKGLAKGQKYDLAANEDEMFGKRTKQYWQAVKKKPAEQAKITPTPKKDEAVAGPITERHPPMNIRKGNYAPWWLQDIVKTAGAAADLARVKKYEPWQQTPEVRLPDATYYDPTRELAANAEQANIQTQGMAAFTGPQALSARSSSIQGQALKNAADIEARYNNLNVGIANQLSKDRTDIMNTASQNKANLDTQLWDKYTVANQQFDNAKNMARQNLRQSYIDAITNRAKTQALNSLYPNFYTDPMRGGFVNKTGYASINPTKPGSDEADEVQKIMDRFPGTAAKDAYDIVRKNKGATDESNPNAGYLQSQGYSGT